MPAYHYGLMLSSLQVCVQGFSCAEGGLHQGSTCGQIAVIATMPARTALQHTRRSYRPERHHVAASACPGNSVTGEGFEGLEGRTGLIATTSLRVPGPGSAVTAKGSEVNVIEPGLQHPGVRALQAMQ